MPTAPGKKSNVRSNAKKSKAAANAAVRSPRAASASKSAGNRAGGAASDAKTSSAPRAKEQPRTAAALTAPIGVSRATAGYDEDDLMMSGGTVRGVGFGRCGGRVLGSRVEQMVCDLLSRGGVTHSHSPRHFEVRLGDKAVAAYAPMIVLRGRGREGKTIVIEAMAEADSGVLNKIRAFRKTYGLEFYVILIAPEDVLDQVPLDLYDESAVTTDAATLINRLSD